MSRADSANLFPFLRNKGPNGMAASLVQERPHRFRPDPGLKPTARIVCCGTMMKLLMAGLAALALSHSPVQAQGTVQPTAAERRLVTEYFRDRLFDPGSAQWRFTKITRDSDGAIICGQVNAKNRFGGYVGFSGFFVVTDKGQVVAGEIYDGNLRDMGSC